MTSSKIPKTGLADVIREWMKSRTGTKAQRRFTIAQMCTALNISEGKDHQAASCTLTDFIHRGEVESYTTAKHNRRQFIHVDDWKKVLKGKINKKVYKAMYVSQTFAVTDLCRLTGIKDRNYFDKVVRQLKRDNYITQVQRRLCSHGAGAENVYHITDRDKFKLELMR